MNVGRVRWAVAFGFCGEFLLSRRFPECDRPPNPLFGFLETKQKSRKKMSKKPDEIAAMIAVILDRDPVAAALVKNHISEARLLELLDLKTPAEELAQQAILQDPDPLNELASKA